jgi:guanylate kinase
LVDAGVLDAAVFPENAPPRLTELPLRTFRNILEKDARVNDDYTGLAKAITDAVYLITVPLTTRARAMHEVPGKDYHYVSLTHFNHLASNDQFFHIAKSDNGSYGTLWPDKSSFAVYNGRVQSEVLLSRAKSIDKEASEARFEVIARDIGLAVPADMAAMSLTQGFAALCRESANEGVIDAVRAVVHGSNVPVTTRPPFKWEKNGREYNFVDNATFKQMVENDEFFEYRENAEGFFYGTLKVGAEWTPEASHANGRKALVEKALAPENEATVMDVVGPDHPICAVDIANCPLSRFMELYPPTDGVEQLHTNLSKQIFFASVQVFGVLTTAPSEINEALCQEGASIWFPRGLTDTVDPQRWDDLLEQGRMMSVSQLQQLSIDGQNIYFQSAVLKLWKADVSKLDEVKAVFATGSVTVEQMRALAIEANQLQESVNSVRKCLNERPSDMGSEELASMLDKLATAVSSDGVSSIPEKDSEAGAAASAAIAPEPVANVPVATVTNPELESKIDTVAAAQEEQGKMLAKILESLGQIAQAVPRSPGGGAKTISPVKKRMESRRSMTQPVPTSPEGTSNSAALTPLKKKLAERRARKEKQKKGGQ